MSTTKNILKHRAIYNTFRKYKWESIIFIVLSIVLILIEFFQELHFEVRFSINTCEKINNILSQLCLAYIASYIFFAINIINRETRKNMFVYPHIIHILRDIFLTIASHEGLLMFISQKMTSNETFEYNKNGILDILSALEKEGTSLEENNKLSAMICDNGIQLAKRIIYNIELLNHFSESFNTDYNSLLYSISQNNFILQLMDKNEIDINDYKRLLLSNIKLYNQIEILRDKSEKIFKIEFP